LFASSTRLLHRACSFFPYTTLFRSLFHDRLVGSAHADACDTSCPDCLRSYSNLAYHNLLDWRLAIDMASLALNANSAISLSSPLDRKSTRLNSSHEWISYAVFCL